jgi:hypothetical protein
VSGARVLFVLPTIPDDADTATKNALAARNSCATDGRCPACGATPEIRADADPELRALGVLHLVFVHDDDCPVLRDNEAAT